MQELGTENEGISLLRGSSERCSLPKDFEVLDMTTASKNSLHDVNQTSISWHGLTVRNPSTGDVILDDISGMAGAGQFIALMGASGGGKTTLLNALQARNLNNLEVSGDVLVDGQRLGIGITNVSGYVQQDEMFLSTLTVKEHLMIQAKLRLVGMDKHEMAERVDAVIQRLNWWIKNFDWESRRLCFASELLDNPPLLFCDEPTTGLDSAMAESVVDILRGLCTEGRTIICTIHQPSSMIYRKFDKVMFLARGRVAFFGPPLEAVEFFRTCNYSCPENYNPADFIIETLAIRAVNKEECREKIRYLCDQFLESPVGQQYLKEVEENKSVVGNIPESKSRPGFFVQVGAIFHRSILDNWRNKAFIRAKVFQKLIMGLIIGFIYFQTGRNLNERKITSLNGALFFIVAELTFPALFGILTVLPREFPLVVREYHDGLYDICSYYTARVLSYLPLFSLDGAFMIAIAYYMVGFASSPLRFLASIGIGILVEQSAAAFGVLLAMATPSYPVAVSIASPILTCLMLTGGMYANLKELSPYVRWLQYLSWFRFGYEALTINQWVGAAEGGKIKVRLDDNRSVYKSAETVLDALSFVPWKIWFCWFVNSC
uniref:ABC transporter domain-containing protein n=1 Tax=Ditylenchus dipsaci TaxID=166011 RepID=A0A915DRI7_9BILA